MSVMIEELEERGFALRRRAIEAGEVERLGRLVPDAHAARNLLWDQPELRRALVELGLDKLAGEALGAEALPINVTFLDKTADANWTVPGHQDLMMPVEREVDTPGFAGWTTRAGVLYVEPPVDVLSSLVAVRVHLDDCPASNGALAVVPGSHHLGKLSDAELREIPREAYVACEAAAGDALILRPLLVHRSSPAESPAHRRVLHVVYAAEHPSATLRWKAADAGE